MDEQFLRDELPFSPATERNKAPIRQALESRMPSSGRLLEIGAGTGQHAVYLAPCFPGIAWLPTDREAVMDGLRRRIELEGSASILEPVVLDVLEGRWPDGPFSAVFSANTAHIMHWEGVLAMFAGVDERLAPGGQFFLYGPFNVNGRFTATSNEAFDTSLKRRDPGMGLRDVGELEELAVRHQMSLNEWLEMPANNFLLVFSRRDEIS